MTDYPPLALFIDGQWRAADGRDVVPVRNPATGAVIGELPCAGIDDINEALASAARGHEQWRRMSAVDRGRILQQAAALILERRERIAGLITLALGKPIAEARAEVETAAGLFVWNAEEGRRAYGRVIPSRQPGVQQIAIPEPLGPIAAFAPWNAPAITPARKISSALAAGCSVIIKPAEETPATALAIAAALVDAGLPSGALNVLFGNPALISQTLLQSPVIRGLTFTGSTEVGKQLGALAAQTLKRSTLELGGHAPVLIFGDVDPEAAAVSAATAKFRNAGQVCTSPTRFFVHESIHDRFAAKLSELAEAIVVGDGFDAATRMGPLAVTAPFGTRDEAIRLANRLPFGLASYVLTHDMRNAAAVSEAIQCGNVIVNHWQASLPETPFGGHKDSGIGSEGGIEGLREFQTLKYVSQLSL